MPSTRIATAEPLPAVAHQQSGVFTTAQARTAGWSDAAIALRRRRGDWLSLIGRGLVLAGAPIERAAPAWAVQLTVPGAVVSHLTAAQWHGFPLRYGPAATPTPTSASTQALPPTPTPTRRGYAIARAIGSARQCRHPDISLSRAALPGADIRQYGSLSITTPTRTAIDVLAILPDYEQWELWAWLSTHGRLDRAALTRAVGERAGRPGTKRLRRLLKLTATGAASPAELRLHRLLDAAGIAGWVANARVSDRDGIIGVVDLLFAAARLVVEVDGRSAHSDRGRFIADRRRQNRLVAAGYTVLRFTWDDLTNRPDTVISHITHLLATKVTESAV